MGLKALAYYLLFLFIGEHIQTIHLPVFIRFMAQKQLKCLSLFQRFCLANLMRVITTLLDWAVKYCIICICSLLFGILFNESFKYIKTVIIKRMMRQFGLYTHNRV